MFENRVSCSEDKTTLPFIDLVKGFFHGVIHEAERLQAEGEGRVVAAVFIVRVKIAFEVTERVDHGW